jgi:RHS repeat-associated protein
VLDANGSASGGVSNKYFVYDGDELSMQFGNAAELTHRYLHGPQVDQVLVDEVFKTVGSQQVSDEVLWLLSDQQGTIRDVVDDTDTLRKHTDYDSFGQITGESYYDASGAVITATHAEAVDQLFHYTGQERDEATGLQKHGGRWYDPRIGRWLSEDPIGFDAGDANLYRYVGNSPPNATDPTGERTLKPYETLPALGGNVTGFGRGNFNPLVTNPALGNISLDVGTGRSATASRPLYVDQGPFRSITNSQPAGVN